MESIWAAQAARGVPPGTREEIDAEIEAMRIEAEEEMQVVERLQVERFLMLRDPRWPWRRARTGLTPEVGGLSSRLNHGLAPVVTHGTP